jgi:hypothetical protein
MFLTVPLSIIRISFTVPSAMVYVIQVCRQLSSRIRKEQSSILILLVSCLQSSILILLLSCLQSSILILLVRCLKTCMTYTIADCTVNELLMMDRGTVRNM